MSSDNIVPLITGSDGIQPGFSESNLGCGFKLNLERGENPFKAKVFNTTNKVEKWSKVESAGFCEVMDSLEKITKHLNIGGHLGVSYGPMISGEGAGAYLKSSTTSRKKSSLHYRAQHIHSFSSFAETELSDGLDKVWDAAMFNKYGTLFVKQIIYGAQLDLTFAVESEEEEDMSELMAELKGAIGFGPLSITFRGKLEDRNKSSNQNYKMRIKGFASGVAVAIPPNPTLEETFAIVDRFNKGYKELCQSANASTSMPPIAFVLGRTQDHIRSPNEMDLQYLNEKMKKVSEAFLAASYWKEMLSIAEKECNQRFTSPKERSEISSKYLIKVKEEIERLESLQEDCLHYRQLPLDKMLGWSSEVPAHCPPLYPHSEEEMKRIDGLLGNGYVPFRVMFDGQELEYRFQGYVIEDEPCLHGALYSGDDLVAEGLARDLASFSPIQNHHFDPEFLKTSIVTTTYSFNPERGDLFMPNDMVARFPRKDRDGNSLKPVFCNKKMVLMGPMGVGKSSLFNRITGSNTKVSDGSETCTTTNSSANALGPAKELVVCDTPGTAASVTNGMTVDQALQLRKGLVTGEVSQIVVVISATNNARAQSYCDQLEPLKGIFDCDTFKHDASGKDVVTMNKRSPHRTRPFVVVTHRDRIPTNAKAKIREFIDKMRKDYPWVGPVAFIDQKVSLGWLYNTVVACAGYQGENLTNYSIPMVEMFSQFKISFPPIKDSWTSIIADAKSDLIHGVACAEHQLKQVEELAIQDKKVGGHYVDKVAPMLDCIIRFVDDLYEKTTQETLAKCYETDIDSLWQDYENEDLLNERFNTLNVIKKELSEVLVHVRRRIVATYPRYGESAVYKKCNNPECSAVYVKPTGCNYLGRCGLLAGVPRDEGHNGTMNQGYQYQYDWNGNVKTSLMLEDTEQKGWYEQMVHRMRSSLRTVAQHLPIHQRSEYYDEQSTSINDLLAKADSTYGCGCELRWDTMVPLSSEELVEKGLVPDTSDVRYEPVADVTSMKIGTFLREKCGLSYDQYAGVFESHGITTVQEAMELHAECGDEMFEELIKSKFHRALVLRKLNAYKS